MIQEGFFPYIFIHLFYVYECFGCMHVHNVHAYRSQKRASHSLALELQMVVSDPVSAGNEAWVPARATSTLNS